MSLLAPTTGQLLDRLSILELKIAHAPDPSHFIDEQLAIEARLGADTLAALAEYLRRLGYVNASLWEEQANVAEASKLPDPPPDRLGVVLFRLNQRRVSLIEEIDQQLGEHVGAEKVYS